MARRAGLRYTLVFLVGVTGFAGRFFMGANQREAGFLMVEGANLGPAFHVMAGLAVVPKAAFMLVARLVTANALTGRASEFHTRFMAGIAGGFLVAANEREI